MSRAPFGQLLLSITSPRAILRALLIYRMRCALSPLENMCQWAGPAVARYRPPSTRTPIRQVRLRIGTGCRSRPPDTRAPRARALPSPPAPPPRHISSYLLPSPVCEFAPLSLSMYLPLSLRRVRSTRSAPPRPPGPTDVPGGPPGGGAPGSRRRAGAADRASAPVGRPGRTPACWAWSS